MTRKLRDNQFEDGTKAEILDESRFLEVTNNVVAVQDRLIRLLCETLFVE